MKIIIRHAAGINTQNDYVKICGYIDAQIGHGSKGNIDVNCNNPVITQWLTTQYEAKGCTIIFN